VNAEADDTGGQPTRDRDWYLQHLLIDLDRFADVVRGGRLDAPIAGCPGWDLRALTAHQGVIHRWARHCAIHAAAPETRDQFEPDPQAEPAALADWLVEGGRALVETLGEIAPDAPTWHPFPAPKLARLWPRRQAQEISVHRWDAEHAVGATAPIDPELASDGVDEYLDLVLRRHVARESATLPGGSLHLHCTDTHGEWLVSTEGGYHLVRAHEKGSAALRGPAEALLLRLWNRDTDRAGELSPVGDESVLESWLGLSQSR
jgi:uncharacterized protein (TIGR03083 family)